MKRRDFLKKSTLAAGLVSAPRTLVPLLESEAPASLGIEPAQMKMNSLNETRSAGYFARARSEKLLPKKPTFVTTLASGVKITPMPLTERRQRGILPRRGFCSISPGRDALLSGNGPISIEVSCNPYSEQVVFRHESVFVPHKHFEAPNIAPILPDVRQMLLEGRYGEAAKFSYEEWHKTPMPRGAGFGGGPAFAMNLDLPRASSVRNYLRTVDFESTELTVHWTDRRGDWVRKTFASRPDNVVVQWLTAPKGHSVNVRIAFERSVGGFFGGLGGVGLEAPLRNMPPGPSGFSPERGGGAQGQFHQDYSEQRLIFKGMLDPEVNTSGYAGVTRVVREGGSATMDGKTLVVENALSLILLTRIEAFPQYSEEQVEALAKAVETIPAD